MSARRVEPRRDVALLPGYHSPQVDVAVRLNTNESPVPPPPELADRLAAAVRSLAAHRYPDRSAGELRKAIASHHGFEVGEVFAANGSNEVLQCLCLAFGGAGRTAALFRPTYALHGHIAQVCGTELAVGERGADFALDEAEVERVLAVHRPEIVFLCSPNNPTGAVEATDLVRRLAEEVPGLLVIDEAYAEFAARSFLDLVRDDLPVVVVRTFSKGWSMAGLRLGYAIAPEWVVAALEKVVLPYHLDAIKQVAGVEALALDARMREGVAAVVAERERLVAGLARLPLHVWPSQANFVLFRPVGRDGHEVWEELLARSVLVRDVSSWPALEGCLRVTVGTPEEDDAFLAALEEVLR